VGRRSGALIALACARATIANADPADLAADLADDAQAPAIERDAAAEGTEAPPAHVDAARVLPLGTTSNDTGAIATTIAGYAGGPAITTSAIATIGRVSLHADASTLGDSPQWRSELGASVRVIRARDFDLDVGGGYQPLGWSGMPELVSRVALGRSIAGGRAQLTAAIGVSTADSDSYGDLDLAASHPVGHGVYAGLDSRVRADLQPDPGDSPTEREWDAQVAAFASRSFGRFALIGSAGVVDWKMRFGAEQTGALALLGVAATFR
jgi:hypothetical protein